MPVTDRMIRMAQANLITLQAARIAELEAVGEVQAKRIRELEAEKQAKTKAAIKEASC